MANKKKKEKKIISKISYRVAADELVEETFEEAMAKMELLKKQDDEITQKFDEIGLQVPPQQNSPEFEKIELTYSEKLRLNENFRKGQQNFRNKTVEESPSIKFQWYSMAVSGKEWEAKHRWSGHPILNMSMNGKVVSEVNFAFRAITPPSGLLQVTNYDDLQKIDRQLRNINLRPFVFEDIEIPKQEKVAFGQQELITTPPKIEAENEVQNEVEEDDGFRKI